jgi:hypothetical protein
MRFNTILFLAIVAIFIGSCDSNNTSDSSKEKKPLVKVPPKTNNTKPAPQQVDPNIGKKAKPGFSTKIERGQKRRETIKDTYDDNGNMIERSDKMFNKYGEVMKKNRYTYKYDDAGRRIEQWYYATEDNDAPIMSNVNYLKYNEHGWKIENIFISYDADGNEVRWAKNEFEYNNDGRIIEDISYDKEGTKFLKVNYNIVDGMLVSENFTYYDDKGEPITKKTISYNEVGTVIGEKEESLK